MRLLSLLALLFVFEASAQTRYTVSGTIVLPDKDDYSPPFILAIRDSAGNVVAGTLDSNLHFEIFGVKNGKYTLSVDSVDFFSMHRCDTPIVIAGHSIENIILNIKPICKVFTAEKAQQDIIGDSSILIMEPGLVHFKYSSRQERRFRRKYHVNYFFSGCLVYDHYSCMKAYNGVIFDHLDNRYGPKWRKHVRKDVVGLH